MCHLVMISAHFAVFNAFSTTRDLAMGGQGTTAVQVRV